MNKSSDRLMSLSNRNLIVGKNPYGVYVEYENCYIKNGGLLEGRYGTGDTFESACDDYLKQISGKTLVFNPNTSDRTEILVL